MNSWFYLIFLPEFPIILPTNIILILFRCYRPLFLYYSLIVTAWILENRPNCHTRPIPFYWPSYNGFTCTLHTHRLDWQAWLTNLLFQSEFCRPYKFMTETMGPMEALGGATWKAYMKFTPVIGDVYYAIQACLALMAGTSGTHG